MSSQEERADREMLAEAAETNHNPEDLQDDRSLSSDSDTKVPRLALKSLSLKTKVKALAIAFSTIPILGIGLGTYFLSSTSTTKTIEKEKQNRTAQLTLDIDRFLSNRLNDVRVLSQQPSLADPQIAKVTPNATKEKIFDDYIGVYGFYSQAIFFDLEGNPIVRDKSKVQLEQSDRDFVRTALQADKATISAPILSKKTGTFYLNIAAPVKIKGAGKTIGSVMLQMPVDRMNKELSQYNGDGDFLHLIDSEGILFLSSHTEEINKPATEIFTKYSEMKALGEAGSKFSEKKEDSAEHEDSDRVLLTYATLQKVAGVENFNMELLLTSQIDTAFASQNYLLRAIALGTLLTAILATLVASYLADYMTRPILKAAEAVSSLGEGNLDVRLEVFGGDELSILSSNINLMVDEMQKLLNNGQKTTEMEAAAGELLRRQEQNQLLQMGLLSFLDQVQEVANGDLTVRAQITEDDIGIVADFFNSIIENLRELVMQVKSVATEVNYTVAENEEAIAKLATNELEQAESIVQTLGLVEKMTDSISSVAGNAKVAADVARNASQNAAAGVKAIEGTVSSITELSETVQATVQKVKRLNDASGRISKVVRLIDEIAMKTKYLAVNAGIEASRAGEEARGFAVVAEQVGQLASSSAAATKEIQQILSSIQQETAEVLGAMQEGNNKVQAGTQLVTQAKQSLTQIFDIARQIDDLVQFISQATVSQKATSQQVQESMSSIAEISNQNSTYSREVSQSLKYSVQIANELNASVNTFKVKEQE
jgi:methyl-accepting chemotaxis protein PixJ